MKKLEIFFKNILLKNLLFFNPVRQNNSLPVFDSSSKLLFIRLNRIGDALVTTPLLTEIKNKIGCTIYVLADKKNHFIFRNNPVVEDVLVFKKGIFGILNINTIIKDKSIDTLIDLHDDVSTTVSFLLAFARVKYKFGLKKSNQSLYTHTVDRLNPENNHVILRIMKLAELFNITYDPGRISIKYFPNEEAKKKAIIQLQEMNPENKFLVGVNISAGNPSRFWGVENYRLLLNELAQFNVRVLLFCTEEELLTGKEITSITDIYPPTKDFNIFASAIMNLDFLITPDTSVVHLASIQQIPVYGIYVHYNTTEMIWSPYNSEFEYVVTEEPTLNNITFEEVKKKLIPFLEKHLNAKTNTGL